MQEGPGVVEVACADRGHHGAVFHDAVHMAELAGDELLDFEVVQSPGLLAGEGREGLVAIQHEDVGGAHPEPGLGDQPGMSTQQLLARGLAERGEVGHRDPVLAQVPLHGHLVAEKQGLRHRGAGDAQLLAQPGRGQQEAFGHRDEPGGPDSVPFGLEPHGVGDCLLVVLRHADDRLQLVATGFGHPADVGDEPDGVLVGGHELPGGRVLVERVADAVQQDHRGPGAGSGRRRAGCGRVSHHRARRSRRLRRRG